MTEFPTKPKKTMPTYGDRPLKAPPVPFKWTHAQCRCCGLWWPLIFVPAGAS